MNELQLVVVSLSAVAIVMFFFEKNIGVSKAATSLIAGVGAFLIIALSNPVGVQETLHNTGAHIIEIFAFLFCAMALVITLEHIQAFDWIRHQLLIRGYTDRGQYWVICAISYIGSAIVDNLTITLVMVTIAAMFFTGRNFIIATAAIVIAANSGGAASPVGDVTTFMLWTGKKFLWYEVVLHAFVPSLVHFLIGCWGLSIQLDMGNTLDRPESTTPSLSWRHWLIIGLGISSFFLPLVMAGIGLPPYMGLLLGVGIVWMASVFLRIKITNGTEETDLDFEMEKVFHSVPTYELLFFVGVLLLVAALEHVGAIHLFSELLLGSSPTEARMAATILGFGWISALIDNVPLTALLMEMLNTQDPTMWTFVAYAVGIGGSHLLIGSAAGVIAQTINPSLTSPGYFKVATKWVLIAYVVGAALFWLLQFLFFR